MAEIEDCLPQWLAKSPSTRAAVLQRITATVTVLAREPGQLVSVPEQAHDDIRVALEKAEKLAKAVKGMTRNHTALAAGEWGTEEGFFRRDRDREFFAKPEHKELGTAYDVGLGFDTFQVALAGFMQRLSEIEEVGRARTGAPAQGVAVLYLDLSKILDKAKADRAVTFEKAQFDAFFDLMTGAINRHIPEVEVRRPSEPTIWRYRKDLKG